MWSAEITGGEWKYNLDESVLDLLAILNIILQNEPRKT